MVMATCFEGFDVKSEIEHGLYETHTVEDKESQCPSKVSNMKSYKRRHLNGLQPKCKGGPESTFLS